MLNTVYKNEFPTTDDYKELVIRLHDNVIEYSFLSQAGLIKSSSSPEERLLNNSWSQMLIQIAETIISQLEY